MAFGDYATLLSSFTGADENPLSEGGNWAKDDPTSTPNLRRVSNQVASTGTNDCHFIWTPTKFGPDIEAYMTVVTKSGALDLTLRVNDAATAGLKWTGYWLQIVGTTWSLYYLLSGTSHLLGSVVQSFSSGDKVGVSIECFTLKAWLFTGGAWSNVLTASDTFERWPAPGNVGFGCDNTTARLDDMYAGTIPRTAPCGTYKPQIYRRVPLVG